MLARWSAGSETIPALKPLAKLEPILAAASALVQSIRDNLPIEGEENVFGSALMGGGWQGQQLVYRQAGKLRELLQEALRYADASALIAPFGSQEEANLAITRLVASFQAFRDWGQKAARAKSRLPTLPRALFAKLEKSIGLLQAVVDRLQRASPSQSKEWSIPTTIRDWAKIFGCHRNTMSKRLQKQVIRNKRVGSHYQIAVDDLPANQQLRYRSSP
jgi:hypothetical protein